MIQLTCRLSVLYIARMRSECPCYLGKYGSTDESEADPGAVQSSVRSADCRAGVMSVKGHCLRVICICGNDLACIMSPHHHGVRKISRKVVGGMDTRCTLHVVTGDNIKSVQSLLSSKSSSFPSYMPPLRPHRVRTRIPSSKG